MVYCGRLFRWGGGGCGSCWGRRFWFCWGSFPSLSLNFGGRATAYLPFFFLWGWCLSLGVYGPRYGLAAVPLGVMPGLCLCQNGCVGRDVFSSLGSKFFVGCSGGLALDPGVVYGLVSLPGLFVVIFWLCWCVSWGACFSFLFFFYLSRYRYHAFDLS